MVAARGLHPRPAAAAPVAAFAAAAAAAFSTARTSPLSPPLHATRGTARPVGPPPAVRRQRPAGLTMLVPPPPEVWHLAPMVLAEQGVPAAAVAFEAFCAGPAAAAAALRRGGGGGGGGGGGSSGGRRRGGRNGFVPAPPPEREAAEVVMHPGWELF